MAANKMKGRAIAYLFKKCPSGMLDSNRRATTSINEIKRGRKSESRATITMKKIITVILILGSREKKLDWDA
jgi:hypothetical protein